jgi:hypothetical protein
VKGACKSCGRGVCVEGGEGERPLVALHEAPWCAHWHDAMRGRYAMAPAERIYFSTITIPHRQPVELQR